MGNTLSGNTLLIADLDTLRTVTHPLRSQIFEILTGGPLTVRQIAERLGLSPGKLYYHVRLLEEKALIRPVEERVVGNLIEKVYQAVATALEVAPDLLNFATDEGKSTIVSLVQSTIDATREDLVRSLEARAAELERGAGEHIRHLIITRELSVLDEAQVEQLQARIVALLKDFDAADRGDAGGGHPYAFTVAFYPRWYFPAEEQTA